MQGNGYIFINNCKLLCVKFKNLKFHGKSYEEFEYFFRIKIRIFERVLSHDYPRPHNYVHSNNKCL